MRSQRGLQRAHRLGGIACMAAGNALTPAELDPLVLTPWRHNHS